MLRGEETAKVTELFNFVFLIARAIAGRGKKEKEKAVHSTQHRLELRKNS